jgi:hypothetical protein
MAIYARGSSGFRDLTNSDPCEAIGRGSLKIGPGCAEKPMSSITKMKLWSKAAIIEMKKNNRL